MGTNGIDDSMDDRDLYAPDGGGDPDSEYPLLTQYQAQRLLDFIVEAEFAYEKNPIQTSEPDEMADVEKAEKDIFSYVSLLLNAKNKYIEELEAVIARKDETIAMLKAAPNLFHDVMTISPNYVKRFGGKPSSEGVFLAFNREHKEFLDACDDLLEDKAAIKLAIGEIHKSSEGFQNYYRRNVVHEAADMLVTIGGILAYLEIEWTDFEQACRATIDKLNGRTEADYAWDGKTVQHKSKIGVNHG